MIFGKKIFEHKICFDFQYNFYLKYFSFWAKFSDILSEMYIGLYVKYSLFLSDFSKPWIFSTYFIKLLEYILWKSVEWELTCTRTDTETDGQTYLTKLTASIRSLAKAPKRVEERIYHYTSSIILKATKTNAHYQLLCLLDTCLSLAEVALLFQVATYVRKVFSIYYASCTGQGYDEAHEYRSEKWSNVM
jgi:hypothetical protein